MNNQLKLLLYIVFIVVIFYFIQDRFSIFDISFIDDITKTESQDDLSDVMEKDLSLEDSTNEEVEESDNNDKSYIEIYRQEKTPVKVNVEVADTSTERSAGLSNRRYLGDYEGMLFIFDEKVSTSFWMKDMYIDLDILFIDEKGFIVDISENMEPCTSTYCPSINSKMMFKYVLEVNAGFCNINGVGIGDSISMHL